MKHAALLVLLSQAVDTSDACRAAGDAIDSVKEAVSPTPNHSCGCEYYKADGTVWNMYACDASGKTKDILTAKHMCCSTCKKVCF